MIVMGSVNLHGFGIGVGRVWIWVVLLVPKQNLYLSAGIDGFFVYYTELDVTTVYSKLH
jgi:hypothetical protein